VDRSTHEDDGDVERPSNGTTRPRDADDDDALRRRRFHLISAAQVTLHRSLLLIIETLQSRCTRMPHLLNSFDVDVINIAVYPDVSLSVLRSNPDNQVRFVDQRQVNCGITRWKMLLQSRCDLE